MQARRFFPFLLVLGVLLAGFLLRSHKDAPPESSPPDFPAYSLFVQNTYMGPIQPIPGNPQLVRVEVLVRDSPEASGVQIQSVIFDGQAIPLKPRDIFGKRASASFQLSPGNYRLRWTVNRDKFAWPRSISHEEEVSLDPRDLWIQILIEGERVSIN